MLKIRCLAGIDWKHVTRPECPLVTDGDFARAKGYLLKIVLLSGKNHRGRLIDWDSKQIALGEDGQKVENVLREEIAKATNRSDSSIINKDKINDQFEHR